MDEGTERGVDPGSYRVESVRFIERIGVRDQVTFSAAIDTNADDSISLDLAAGRFPESTRPALECLLASTPRGARVLDLGTHIGSFTLAAAAMGYEVIGVEASPQNAFLLRASLERNGFDRVHLVNAAVSDRPGTLEFSQGGPYGHVGMPGSGDTTVSVPAVRIDDLMAERGWDRVDFLKMDIEGSEIAGLQGMPRLLSSPDAPMLLVESNGHTLNFFNKTPSDLKAALAGFGYRNYLVEGDQLYPVRAEDFQPGTCVDYLAVKRSLADLAGYRVNGPLGHQEVVDRLVQSARSPGIAERCYIARALASAAPELLAAKRVLEAIESLRQDPCEEVRAAAIAISLPVERKGWLAGLHRGISAIRGPFVSRQAAHTSSRSKTNQS